MRVYDSLHGCAEGGIPIQRVGRQWRWIWRMLIMAEAANLADWVSTLIGVGGQGQPELNPVAVALMHSFGVIWGTSLFKALVALELVGIAGAAVFLGGQKAMAGSWWPWVLFGALMLATLALCTITVYNLRMILHAVS
jgi:hypothetical protein